MERKSIPIEWEAGWAPETAQTFWIKYKIHKQITNMIGPIKLRNLIRSPQYIDDVWQGGLAALFVNSCKTRKMNYGNLTLSVLM